MPPIKSRKDEEPRPPVARPVVRSSKPPSLTDAFDVLCVAVLDQLEELPDIAYVKDIQIRYTDGHHTLAWAQIWRVLEGIVGTVQ